MSLFIKNNNNNSYKTIFLLIEQSIAELIRMQNRLLTTPSVDIRIILRINHRCLLICQWYMKKKLIIQIVQVRMRSL